MNSILYNIAKNCDWHKTVNDNYIDVCEDRIAKLEQLLPSGSGVDSGCKIDIPGSGSDRVVIFFSYHFMNDAGFYDGWGDYKLIAKPSLTGFDLRIVGKNRREIKSYLHDLFYENLKTLCDDK